MKATGALLGVGAVRQLDELDSRHAMCAGGALHAKRNFAPIRGARFSGLAPVFVRKRVRLVVAVVGIEAAIPRPAVFAVTEEVVEHVSEISSCVAVSVKTRHRIRLVAMFTAAQHALIVLLCVCVTPTVPRLSSSEHS